MKGTMSQIPPAAAAAETTTINTLNLLLPAAAARAAPQSQTRHAASHALGWLATPAEVWTVVMRGDVYVHTNH